jgi:phenylacetic acid degradation operon negative regulatory protein
MSSFRNAAPRSLTARSVLLSVLLGSDPPRLPVSLLVSTTELFGISEGTTRTALSRMAAQDEVRAESGSYELTSPRLLRRQARQETSRAGHTEPWAIGDGWLQAVVVAEGRRPAAERAELRRALHGARLAEWRDGVWLRPANLVVERSSLEEFPLVWGEVRLDTDPTELAGQLWDLDAWSGAADALLDEMASHVDGLEAGRRDLLAPGFVLSASVLRHLQGDPLLPASLVDDRWPGARLRAAYARFDVAYRDVLRDWFDEHRDGAGRS